jgi:predicted alpha/beta-fold hydrolase
VPALILSAQDDPFVPGGQFRDAAVLGNARIQARVERHGGHCGFVAQARPDDDGYWAETTAIDFLGAIMPPEFRAR